MKLSYFINIVFVMIAIAACNRATYDADFEGTKKNGHEKLSYPHPKGWGEPSQHGAAYLAATDKAVCLACHDQNQTKTTATRCDTCHQAFPHTSKFKKGRHADVASTFAGKCLICHTDYKANMPNFEAEGGCRSCHDGQLKIQWVEEPPPAEAPAPVPAPAPASAPGR